ncbi:hypothetical protein [Paraburkholderia sp. BL23I1N1]|uniref:hypothetical protein n=1 Tax=Paraburkholderia sp. BL23I1N1 TaxID=1938802 RepID=UPI0016049D17|nr:hypothetical protein [Paraburkholderia sp. BL23I1N1]
MTRDRCTRLPVVQPGNKKPLHRESERSGFLLRRNGSAISGTQYDPAKGALKRVKALIA